MIYAFNIVGNGLLLLGGEYCPTFDARTWLTYRNKHKGRPCTSSYENFASVAILFCALSRLSWETTLFPCPQNNKYHIESDLVKSWVKLFSYNELWYTITYTLKTPHILRFCCGDIFPQCDSESIPRSTHSPSSF